MTDNKAKKHSKVDDSVKSSLVQNKTLKKLLIVLFSAFLGIVLVGTWYWGEMSLKEQLRYAKNEGIEAAIASTETEFNENLLDKEYFIDLYGGVVRLADMDFVRDADYSYSVIKDNHNNLQFITFDTDYTGIEKDFAIYGAGDAPVIFIQPPTKYIEGYTEFPPSLEDKTTENVDNLLSLLQAQNIPTLDLRETAKAELDLDNVFFRTDHHWTIETAFWAVDKSVDFIKETTGIDLDPENYYTDINNWNLETHEKSFLGSQGRRVGTLYGGLDDFTVITPNFDTDYHIYGIDGNEERQGSFEEAVLDDELLDFDASVWENHYAGYWGQDDAKVVADNLLNDDGAKVLLIKDSYGLPYGAFLSAMTDSLTIVDLRYYDIGELQNYIQKSDFDLVIVLYKMYNVEQKNGG